MKKKNSQIFMFDLILSIVILVVSVGIILTYFVDTSNNSDIYDLNNQILNEFTQTKINSLNNIEIRQMFIDNKITNIDNTVAQQVAEFYYLNENDLAKNLTRIFVKDYIENQMNFNLTFSNSTSTTELFSVLNIPNHDYKNSKFIAYSKRIIFGFINSTAYFGPYSFEVRLWV